MAATPSPKDKVIVVGAGLFGLTISLELSKRGYQDITVLDRHLPPVPDGSSVDISRVIRPDYADPFYAKMMLEALEGWNSTYKSFFHQSGIMCISRTKEHPYITSSKENVTKLGLPIDECDGRQAKERFPGLRGGMDQMGGYINKRSGWADARGSIGLLAQRCSDAGISFRSGDEGTVTSLIVEGRKITGVRTNSQRSVLADMVILSVGSWTPYLVNMSHTSVSTGQAIGYLQLSQDEADELTSLPTIIDFSTGWYCFPPTPDTNILKMARHGYGYEIRRNLEPGTASTPSLEKDNAASTFIPDEADDALHEGLEYFFPQFAGRKFIKRRLCWYQDTANGDFIADYHPDYDNLFLACGGSGHAFKFLPVLGRYLVDNFTYEASTRQRQKWAWQQSSMPISKVDGSRGGPPRRELSQVEQARL